MDMLKQLYEKKQSISQLHADLLSNRQNPSHNCTPDVMSPWLDLNLLWQQLEQIIKQLQHSITLMESRYAQLHAQVLTAPAWLSHAILNLLFICEPIHLHSIGAKIDAP